MKLIEFEDRDNDKVYINPEYVQYVVEEGFHKNITTISLLHGIVYVKGDPLDVAQKLIRGYSV